MAGRLCGRFSIAPLAMLALVLCTPSSPVYGNSLDHAERLPPVGTAVSVRPTTGLLAAESRSSGLVNLASQPAVVPVTTLPDGGECDRCLTSCGGWLQNVDVFLGLDGSKQPQDFGINAQFGGRSSINWGIPIFQSLGIGAQIGTAIDATADAVQVMQITQGTSGRTQSFTTAGIFQRLDNGFAWGVVYDFLYENYYNQFSLAQWRVNLGYQLTERSNVGVWSAISDRGATAPYTVAPFAIPVTLTPITQTNAYWRYEWNGGIQTTFWGGIANSHSQVNGVLGDLDRIRYPFVFGAELNIPLTDRLAIFGQGNFITPASSGTVDSYLGLVYYPGGGSRSTYRSPFRPLQTVAAPTNFAVDLRR